MRDKYVFEMAKECYEKVLDLNEDESTRLYDVYCSYISLKKIVWFYVVKYATAEEIELYVNKILKTTKETLKGSYDLLFSCSFSMDKLTSICKDQDKIKKIVEQAWNYSTKILKKSPQETHDYFDMFKDVRLAELKEVWKKQIENIISSPDASFESVLASTRTFNNLGLTGVISEADSYIRMILFEYEFLYGKESISYKEVLQSNARFLKRLK